MLVRVLVALLAITACSMDDGTTIGKACEGGQDCVLNAQSACILRWPDGYCTEFDCTLGACPSGSRCVRGVSFQDVGFDAFCLDECSSENDCRTGYACAATDSTLVCVPRN